MRQRNMLKASAIVLATMAWTRPVAGSDLLQTNERIFVVTAAGGQNQVVQTRTLAMVHAAVHDALNTIEPRFERYALQIAPAPAASADAAVATALHAVLIAVIPSFGTPAQQAAARALAEADYAAALAAIPNGPAKDEGIRVGAAAAAAVVARRADEGLASINPPYTPSNEIGYWRPTPNPDPPSPAGISFAPAALPGWGNLTPFALRTGAQFGPEPPPALGSAEYVADYEEVKRLGEQFSVARTAEQSDIARFWYEASGAGWNRIARVLAAQRGLDVWDQARLLALVNFALADGFIAGWHAKYLYNYWRPVTAIREGDRDGDPQTAGDPGWNTYLNTPAIPDYPSTHSVLGAAAAEVMARFFGDDAIAFQTTSGAPFAGITRSYESLSGAARENADSRVYAGLHFRTACVEGLRMGKKIGRFTFGHELRPLR